MSRTLPRMARPIILALSAAVLAAGALVVAPAAGQQQQEKPWVDLLEGNELAKHWHTKGNWNINEEGVVRLTPRPGETGWSRFDAYLWLNTQYGDFEIEFEYMVEKRGNSGFYFRVADEASPVAKGIEVQIYDSYGKAADARLTDHDSGGIIPGLPPTQNTAKAPGEWNKFHITSQNDKLVVRLNGQVVNEVDLTKQPLATRPKRGSIGFQDHALPLALRKIRIREL
jgi:hypothetical protein